MTPFSTWKTIGYAAAIFVTGGISGGSLGYIRASSRLATPPGDKEIALRIRDRLQDKLALTPDQIAKVNPIIDQAATDLRVIRTDSAQRAGKVFDDSYAQISAILTPDQRAKLDQIQKRRHEMAQLHAQDGPGNRRRPGGPSGGPDHDGQDHPDHPDRPDHPAHNGPGGPGGPDHAPHPDQTPA